MIILVGKHRRHAKVYNMTMQIGEDDVYLLHDYHDRIVVGFGFKYFNQDAPDVILYRGLKWSRGNLDVIPARYSSIICSARQYERRW